MSSNNTSNNFIPNAQYDSQTIDSQTIDSQLNDDLDQFDIQPLSRFSTNTLRDNVIQQRANHTYVPGTTCLTCLTNLHDNWVNLSNCGHTELCLNCVNILSNNNTELVKCPSCRTLNSSALLWDGTNIVFINISRVPLQRHNDNSFLLNIPSIPSNFINQIPIQNAGMQSFQNQDPNLSRPPIVRRMSTCPINNTRHMNNIVIPSVPPSSNVVISQDEEIFALFKSIIQDDVQLGTTYLHFKKDSNDANFDYYLVIDKSGSMSRIIEQIKDATINLIDRLPIGARLTIIAFDSYCVQLFALQPITPTNKDNIIRSIRQIIASGGTNMNDTIQFLINVITEAKTSFPERAVKVGILSDGKPDNPVTNTLIETLHALITQIDTISIGPEVEAQHLIALLNNKPIEIAKYLHCTNINEFNMYLDEMDFSDAQTIGTNLVISSNVQVLSSTSENNIITIPRICAGDSINIPFKASSNLIPRFTYRFTKSDSSICEGEYTCDEINALPEIAYLHYPQRKLLQLNVEEILNREISNNEKHTIIQSLFDESTVEIYGDYLSDVKSQLTIILDSLNPVNIRNVNIQNRFQESQLRTPSNNMSGFSRIEREISENVSARVIRSVTGSTSNDIEEESYV